MSIGFAYVWFYKGDLCSASDIISQKKQWWHHKMVAVSSGQWFLSIKN